MKITTKGQVTIPQALREKHGLLPFSEVEFVEHRDGLMLVKASKSARGRKVLSTMMDGGKISGSTAQLLQLTRGE